MLAQVKELMLSIKAILYYIFNKRIILSATIKLYLKIIKSVLKYPLKYVLY